MHQLRHVALRLMTVRHHNKIRKEGVSLFSCLVTFQ